ncbi:MAG TPA: protein kinase [Anaerolineae bacterium]
MNPEKIGRYEINSELGRGGMATVFERTVAVKVLPREFMHDPQFRARFVREARTIAALEHPAIVPVYDFGEDDGQPYLVMRIMPGGSLADRLKQGPLSIEETATILRRLGSALNRAHGQGIFHRDLKPNNILFDQYGDAFLSDFGIVHIASSSSALTASGSLVGTPTYMSPEQVYGDKALDGRSDVYALGIILFQMLTGHLPYEADTPARIMMKHVMDPVPEILKVRPDLPPACNDIITKAMAKKPDERFATAGDLSEALASLATRKMEQPDVAEKLADVRAGPTAQWDMALEPLITPSPPLEPPSPAGETARPAAGLRAIPVRLWGAFAALALVCLATVGVASWLLRSGGFAFLAGTVTPTVAPLSSPTTAIFVADETVVPAEPGGEEPSATEPAAVTSTPPGPTSTPDLATLSALPATPTTDISANLAAIRESVAAT